jgi:hypothetical protein
MGYLPAWRPIELPADVGRDPRSALPVVVGVLIVPLVRFLWELPAALFGRER